MTDLFYASDANGNQIDGYWTDANSWSLDYVPGASDDAAGSAAYNKTIYYDTTDEVHSFGSSGADLDITGGSLTVNSGTDYYGNTIINQGSIEVAAGASFSLAAGAGTYQVYGFDNAGTLIIGSGSTLETGGTIGGVVSGTGTLVFQWNSTLTTSLASLSEVDIDGSVTLGVDFDYGGTFVLNDNKMVVLSGYSMTLSGASITLLAGGIEGDGVVDITGTAVLNGVNFLADSDGNAATVTIDGSVTQTGNITIAGELTIASSATYTITTASAIEEGSDGTVIVNDGTPVDAAEGVSEIGSYQSTVTNNGTLIIEDGATLELFGTDTLGGTITGAGTLRIDGNATIDTNISVASLLFDGYTSTLASGFTSYAGTFETLRQTTFNLAGQTITLTGESIQLGSYGYFVGPSTVVVDGPCVIDGFNLVGTTLEDSDSMTLTDNLVISDYDDGTSDTLGELLIDSGATFTFAPTSNNRSIFVSYVANTEGSVVNNGTFKVDYDDSYTSSLYCFVNNASFVITDAYDLRIYTSLDNEGTLDVGNGMLTVCCDVTGSGSVVVEDGGAVVFDDAFDQDVTFEGAGTLSLAESYSGTISGFGIDDSIDLSFISYSSGEKLVLQSNSDGIQIWAVESADNTILTTLTLSDTSAAFTRATIVDDGSGYASLVAPIYTTTSDFDGSGTSDVLLRNAAGVTYLWSMEGASVTGGTTTSVQVGTNWQIEGIADFDGNGTSDILWVYNNAADATDGLNGVSYISFQDGADATDGGVVQQLSSDWAIAGVGDFTGDGEADVLYRNSGTGQTYLDVMNGSEIDWSTSGFTTSQVTDGNWSVAAVADFNGDGTADVLWRYYNASDATDSLNGTLYEWQMDGTTVSASGLLSQQASGSWEVAGTGDFNGDGTADILFRYDNASDASDPLNGVCYIDFMDGTTVSSGSPTGWQVDESWQVASIGDYDGDGTADILWQQTTTGDTYLWTMSGAEVTSGAYTSAQAGSGWTVENGVLVG